VIGLHEIVEGERAAHVFAARRERRDDLVGIFEAHIAENAVRALRPGCVRSERNFRARQILLVAVAVLELVPLAVKAPHKIGVVIGRSELQRGVEVGALAADDVIIVLHVDGQKIAGRIRKRGPIVLIDADADIFARRVGPADQPADRIADLARQRAVEGVRVMAAIGLGFGANFLIAIARIGVAIEIFRAVERHLGLDIDRAADALRVHVRRRRFDHLHRAEHAAGNDVERRLTSAQFNFRRSHLYAVDCDIVQLRGDAANLHIAAFAFLHEHRHARHAIEALAHILIGQLAQFIDAQRLDDARIVLFGAQRLFARQARPNHHDLFNVIGARGRRRRALRLRCPGHARGEHCGKHELRRAKARAISCLGHVIPNAKCESGAWLPMASTPAPDQFA